jgi:N,N'-diacetyllegionaminate synthase
MKKINQYFNNNFKNILTIAEIGINHDGNLNKAFKLIQGAKKAKFKAVKFQIYKVEHLLKSNTPLAEYQKKTGNENMYELLKKYSFRFDEFQKLKAYCDNLNISFLATPFDNESAHFLNKLDVEAYKISSGDLNNFYLLKCIKSFKKPIIISTGLFENKDLKKTLNFLNYKKKKLAILHCISSYPTELCDTQLSNIKELKKFNYPVGFSDHTIGKDAAVAALSLGARIFEKHITLDNKSKGPDHSSSLLISDASDFISTINNLEISLKTKRNITLKESKNKKLVTRSFYFLKDLPKNHKITDQDIIPLRPYKNGFPIEKLEKIIGKKTKYKVKKNSVVKKNIII